MGLLGDLTGGTVGDIGISFGGVTSFVSNLITFLGVIGIIGGLFAWWYYRKRQKTTYNKKIHIFEEINGQFIPSSEDTACEINIPGTSLKVFYLKKRNLYLARGTKQMGHNHYWYGIRSNGEWVNFTITNLNKELEEAGLDYDHIDMKYANTQLKRLMASQFKKKEKWWEKYQKELTLVIFILLMTFAIWFLLSKVEDIANQLGPLVDGLKESNRLLMESLQGFQNQQGMNSGIRPGG